MYFSYMQFVLYLRCRIEGATRPDHEGSKTNFSKWSNVEFILSDSFIIRTLDDKCIPRMIGLDIFPDGKILVNDIANNSLKLFDDEGIL